MNWFEILLYLRLVIYPVLALLFLMYAYTGERRGEPRNSNAAVFVAEALLFLGLWGSSITLFSTRDNTAVLRYNSIALIPVLIATLVLMIVLLLRHRQN